MSGNVLVAVDLSHRDEDVTVLTKARELAERDQALLNVITVLPDFGMTIVSDFFDEGTQKKAVARATEKLHAYTAKHLGPDFKVRHVIANGIAYEEILSAAQKVDADLIVIGAHRPRFRDYLLGPNAARVVRFAKSSVYVVRD